MVVLLMQDKEEDIVENKDLLLKVFRHLKSRLPCSRLNHPLSSSSGKRTWDGQDDSAAEHPPKKASCSDSVQNQLTGLDRL